LAVENEKRIFLKHINHIPVTAAIIERDGKILIAKRREPTGTGKNPKRGQLSPFSLTKWKLICNREPVWDTVW
jgi:hypothetical protein